jgi:hypothetical protein
LAALERHMGETVFLCVCVGVLILGGLVALWIGPDVGGKREDGTPGPATPAQLFRIRLFAIGCILCGALLLIAKLLGFPFGPEHGPRFP